MSYDVQDFQVEVLERSKQNPVLVDFWADWCGPCKVLGPILERLAAEADGRWSLAKVDTEAHREIATRYNIRSIPNVKLFVDGKMETEFVGALPEPMLRQWLEKNVPTKSRKEVESAEQLIRVGKPTEAQIILNAIVKAEPQNTKARVLLARTLLATDQARAVQLVEGIEADSEHYDRAEAIRAFATLSQKKSDPDRLPDSAAKQTYIGAIASLVQADYAKALEQFITVIRTDRYFDDDGARKACIAIFKLLGEEHEVTKEHRREFSRALY